jgi:hypothetical protein
VCKYSISTAWRKIDSGREEGIMLGCKRVNYWIPISMRPLPYVLYSICLSYTCRENKIFYSTTVLAPFYFIVVNLRVIYYVLRLNVVLLDVVKGN